MPSIIIKSKTNLNDCSKQYFRLQSAINMDDGLIIRKYVLTENPQNYYSDFKLVKRFRNKYLMFQTFAIKIKTLNQAIVELKM